MKTSHRQGLVVLRIEHVEAVKCVAVCMDIEHVAGEVVGREVHLWEELLEGDEVVHDRSLRDRPSISVEIVHAEGMSFSSRE